MSKAQRVISTVAATAIGMLALTGTSLAGNGLSTAAARLAKPPVIDGTISANEYDETSRVSYADPNAASEVTAVFYTGWDDSNLYFAAKVKDADVVGDLTDPKASVWVDDDIEIYIDALNEGNEVRGETDFQILWGAAGGTNTVIGDGNGGYDFDSWNPKMNSVTKVYGSINDGGNTDDGFVVEAAIPWSDLTVKPKSGLTIGFNVTSFDYSTEQRDATIGFFSWQPEVGLSNNHNPSFWGTLRLK